MQRRMWIGLVMMGLVAGVASKVRAEMPAELKEAIIKQIDASDLLAEKTKVFVKEKLLPHCTNPVFVQAVAQQNAKKMTLDEIKKIDETWQKAEEELPIQKELMNNACAQEIKRIVAELRALNEVFVMDNQGANVGQNALTSDYWQGDEAKWQKSYNGGKGGVDIAKPVLDKSTDVVDQKVSLPIVDENGQVIGAVCWGIRVDAL